MLTATQAATQLNRLLATYPDAAPAIVQGADENGDPTSASKITTAFAKSANEVEISLENGTVFTVTAEVANNYVSHYNSIIKQMGEN